VCAMLERHVDASEGCGIPCVIQISSGAIAFPTEYLSGSIKPTVSDLVPI
jgi:hypothetical protein